MTYYKRLGVSRSATPEVIRAAYKALAYVNHPDRNQDNPAATLAMQEINQAYSVLSDPQKRAAYDLELFRQDEEAPLAEQRAASPSSAPQRWTYSSTARPGQSSAPQQSQRAGSKTGTIVSFVALVALMAFFLSYSFLFSPVTSPPPPMPPAVPASRNMATTPAQLAQCIFVAAQTYHVPPSVILGILSTEKGVAEKETPVAGNGADLGPMQINTWWLPQLSRIWHLNVNQTRMMVRDDACINVGVGAWIFHMAMTAGGSLPEQIARYDGSVHHLASRGKAKQHNAYVAKALRFINIYKTVRSPADLLGDQKKPARDEGGRHGVDGGGRPVKR